MTYADLNMLLAELGILVLGGILGYLISGQAKRNALAQVEMEAEKRIAQNMAEEERSQHLELLEEKDQWYKAKAQQEQELEDQLAELNQREKGLADGGHQLQAKREELDKDLGRFRQQESRILQREKTAKDKDEALNAKLNEYRERLEVVANLSIDEAREQMMEHLAGEVRARSAAMIRAERARAKEESEREAKKIIAMAIQRCAVEEAVQVTTSSVPLPNEGIKSRIIGKEGRNVALLRPRRA